MRRYLTLSLVFAALSLTLPAHASSLTNSQIQALEGLLSSFNVPQATITTVDRILRGQPVTAVGGTTGGGGSGYVFTHALDVGSQGTDVTELQTLLKAQGYFTYPTATGYFGPATAAAVAAFQKAHHIEAIGGVGPLTRNLLNQLESQQGSTVSNPSTSSGQAANTPTQTVPSTPASGGGGGTPTTIQNYTPPAASGGGGGGSASGGSSSGSASSGSSSSSSGSGTPVPAADTTPPSVTVTAPTINLAAGTTQTSLSAATNEAASCRYSTTASFTFSSGTLFATTGNTSHSTTISGLTNGSTHTYYVKCSDTAGNVSGNASVTFTVAAPDSTAPTAPTNLAATALSSSQISLTWTASTDAVGVTGYQVFRNNAQIATPSTTSYSDTGLTASTLYSYTIKATDAAGNVSAASTAASATTGASGSGGYAGFLDTYSSLGATWGFSSYKLTNAYVGNWGTVARQSDGATTPIGFDASGKANVGAFNSFCAGTNCYVTSLNDQVNGINATQSILAKMPRAFVDSNGAIAVCPQPGSTMATPYSSVVNTAKVHLFAVAQLNYADSRWSQSTTPAFSVTGNVTKGSNTISNLSSAFGISAANNGGVGQVAGVTDSAGLLPISGSLNSISGTTAAVSFAPGNLSPTGSMIGDTIIFHNAVLPGAWIVNGPPSSTYYSSAYWGVGVGADTGPSSWSAPRNGSIGYMSSLQNVLDQGMRGQWAVYDYDTNTTQLNYDGATVGKILGAAANVTYPTNAGMTLFSDTNGNEGTSNSCFETMVLFPNTETSRIPMAQSLAAQDNISPPAAPATADGFTMTGEYLPSYTSASNNALGAYSVGPDAHGLTWNLQSGGYTWPSVAYANNITNAGTLWRFIVQQGDSDMNITGAERAEIAESTVQATPGNSFSFFYQFNFEQLPQQNGDWCASGQIHYNNAAPGANAPDIVSFSCTGNKIQFTTQKTSGGNPVTTNCGAPITLTPGTTYAVAGTGFWSSNHTSDTLTINAGPNGSALPLVCSVGPTALWDNDTGAYLKAGIYRGYPWSNAGTAIERVMNPQFTATANAFSSFITAQPALPTHTGGSTPASSDTTAPSTPTGLSVTAVSSSAINISWTASTDNVGVTGYKIFRGGIQIGTSAANSYSDSGLTASTNYSYTVSAYDAAGNNSTQSSSANATTQAGVQDTTPPTITVSAPSGQLAANTTSTTLSVTTNENATCAYSPSAGIAFASMAAFTTTGGTSHSTTLSSLVNGSSYITYVKCKDTAGNISTDSAASYSVASATGGGGGGTSCTAADSFLARVSVDATHQSAYQTLICGLVADGVWSKLDILYIFATANQSTALTNLMSNAYSASVTGLPTFTADSGFSNGGNGKGVDLGWSPANGVNYQQYAASVGGWQLDNSCNWGGLIESDVTNLFTRNPHNVVADPSGCDTEININSPVWNNVSLAPEISAAGWWSVDRYGNNTMSPNAQVYFDGVADGSPGSLVYDSWPSTQHLFAAYDAGNTAPPSAAAYAGGDITAAQHLALYNRIHAYLQAIAGLP